MSQLVGGFSGKIEIQQALILFMIVLAPFLGVAEIVRLIDAATMLGNMPAWQIKILKDLLITLSIFCGIFFSYFRPLKIEGGTAIVFFASIYFSASSSLLIYGSEAVAAGVRWLFPIFFYLTLKPNLPYRFYFLLTRTLEFVLVAALLLQIYQLYFMTAVYGQTSSGLSLRNPGFYLIPSSMAAFAIAGLYFVLAFEHSRLRKLLHISVVVASVVLTASGAGIISLILLAGAKIYRRLSLWVTIPLALFVSVTVVAFLPELTSREHITYSLLTRIDILVDRFSLDASLSSESFGLATNTLVSLKPDLYLQRIAMIADSMVSSSLVNIGLFASIILFTELFFRPLMQCKRSDYLLYVSCFGPFFLSTVLFELFPVNILMFLALNHIRSKASLGQIRLNL